MAAFSCLITPKITKLDKKGIFFTRKKKRLIAIYGDYLGSLLHKIVTGREQLDRRCGCPIKPYYTYWIMGIDSGKPWLLVG